MRATGSMAMQSEINVTPLVDVCLVLLIIFMVVTPILVKGVPVNLPSTATTDPLGKQPLQITINADGVVYAGDSVLRIDQLADELQKLRALSDRPVIVRTSQQLWPRVLLTSGGHGTLLALRRHRLDLPLPSGVPLSPKGITRRTLTITQQSTHHLTRLPVYFGVPRR